MRAPPWGGVGWSGELFMLGGCISLLVGSHPFVDANSTKGLSGCELAFEWVL